MGFLKQMKDAKNAIHEAPGMIAGAQQLQAQAQQLAATQQQAAAQRIAQMQAPGAAGTADAADLEPIAGVSLEKYAQVSRGIADRQLDQYAVPGFVSSQGIDPGSWEVAVEGWNGRMKGNTALAVQYGNLYTKG